MKFRKVLKRRPTNFKKDTKIPVFKDKRAGHGFISGPALLTFVHFQIFPAFKRFANIGYISLNI